MYRNRRAARMASVVVVSIAAFGVIAAAGSAAAEPNAELAFPSGIAVSSAACPDPSPLVSVQSMRPNGSRVAAAADGLAKIYTYRTAAGLVQQTMPPVGWSALRATDAEREMYGFPTKPTDPSQLATWTEAMSITTYLPPAGFCTSTVSSAVSHTATNPYWAGGMTVNGSATTNTYTSTAAQWVEPSFVNSGCPGTTAQSGMSIWSGLGGWNSDKLIQAGTDNAGLSTLNTSSYFYELINGSVDTREVYPGGTASLPSGHEAYITVSYNTSSHYASFMFEDLTARSELLPVSVSNASQYYEGTTADFVSEAPAGGPALNGRFYLRKPTSALSYTYAVTNGSGVSHFSSWRINEVNANGTMQTSSFDGINAWKNTWSRCG